MYICAGCGAFVTIWLRVACQIYSLSNPFVRVQILGLAHNKKQRHENVTLLFILARPEGFPRTAHMCRLWGIRDDLAARGLPNLLIVEPFCSGSNPGACT